MPDLYPATEPYETGLLDAGDGQLVYWETCGNPAGKPAVVVHGGPGSGCSAAWRRFIDPNAYRVVLFDQRNCGRSRPHASDASTDLSTNDTSRLIGDMERLRQSLGIDRWLVFGGSWGCTQSLAYAETHPGCVSEMVLFGVTTGQRSECDWTFRGGLSLFFPDQWDRLVAALPPEMRNGDVVEAYAVLLNDPDPQVRRRAAEEWCLWESATPNWPPRPGLAERFIDPDYALAFARIVTHYVRHDLFLEDGVLIRNAGALAAIPGILVHGRFDFQAPVANASVLKQAWPRAELMIVDQSGHGTDANLSRELIRATDRFAA